MMIQKNLRQLLGVALLCGSGWAVQADENVTFQVDLSRYTNSAGQQAATLVDVRGAFNGWAGGSTLINNGANVYTNTFNVVGSVGDKFQYKFTYTTPPGITWEDNNPPPGAGQPPDEGNNRVLQLTGADQVLPVVPFYAPSVTPPLDFINNNVTFQVDMTAQIAISAYEHGQPVRISGAFTGWGDGVDMTNNPALSGDASNIFSCTIVVSGGPGSQGGQYKFRANGGWENDGVGPGGAANRNFTITGGDQVLPVVYYNNIAPAVPTNGAVTFRVDMTPQVLTGGFINGVGEVRVSGGFNGWGAGDLLTNNPALATVESNIYSTTLAITNFPNTAYRYKFRANGGWESAAIYGVGINLDREFFLAGNEQILPLVTYNDASLCDVLLEPTSTTFVLQVTNGTVATDGTVFVKDPPGTTRLFINGEFNGWQGWNEFLPELVNNPAGSDFYEITIPLPAGAPRAQKFKFGMLGASTSNLDNEAPTYQDHISYIRTFGPTATLPVAQFGTNYAATRVEPSFGNLKAGTPSGGNVPITWLGGPCITLQTRASLTSGNWTDLPATDATGSTNWPNTGGAQMFRLRKRPLP